MKFKDVQSKAKDMGVNPYRMKKADIIRSIQRRENSIDCYGTIRMGHCGEVGCLWRSDCLSLNNNGMKR